MGRIDECTYRRHCDEMVVMMMMKQKKKKKGRKKSLVDTKGPMQCKDARRTWCKWVSTGNILAG